MPHDSWKEHYTSAENWRSENVLSNDVIKLLDCDVDACATNIIQNNNLVVLTLDPVTNELIMVHHFTQIGGSLRMKESKLVALNGFGPLASIVRFKSANETFGHVVNQKVPSFQDFFKVKNSKDFKALAVSNGSDPKTFRNLLLLPPYVASAFLSASSRKPSDLACAAMEASKNFKNECKDIRVGHHFESHTELHVRCYPLPQDGRVRCPSG